MFSIRQGPVRWRRAARCVSPAGQLGKSPFWIRSACLGPARTIPSARTPIKCSAYIEPISWTP